MSKHPENYCPVFGNYPKEYNKAVHGPYYPWVNYGPRDTAFKDVKLGELTSWLSRRQKTPAAFIAAFSRNYATYVKCWLDTRYGSPSKWVLQTIIMTGVGSMLLSYGFYKNERSHKYHW